MANAGPMQVPSVQLLTRREAAQRLAVSVRTLRRWSAQGLVPVVRLRGLCLYDLRDLNALVAAAKRPGSASASTHPEKKP